MEIKNAIERLAHSAFALQEIKFDSGDGADAMTFSGYGAVFGNVDAYGDVIQKGAFADTLAESRKSGIWPAMLSQHGGWGMTAEDMTPVGIWIDLEEDSKGLKVKGKLADTPRGRELHSLMKMAPRPAIDGLSIGYIPKEFTLRTKPEEPRRTLKKVHLVEISPVTFPANQKARVRSVKAIEDLQSLAEVEKYLRDAGFTKSEAVAVVSRCKNLGRGDPDGGQQGLNELAEIVKRNTSILTNP